MGVPGMRKLILTTESRVGCQVDAFETIGEEGGESQQSLSWTGSVH